jgi:hypothetical protein
MTQSEKLCEGNLSTSLLDESNRSDAARSSSIDIGNSDCENRTEMEKLRIKSTCRFWAWPVAIDEK